MKKIIMLLISFIFIISCATTNTTQNVQTNNVDKTKQYYVQFVKSLIIHAWSVGYKTENADVCVAVNKSTTNAIIKIAPDAAEAVGDLAEASCRLGVSDSISGENHLQMMLNQVDEVANKQFSGEIK